MPMVIGVRSGAAISGLLLVGFLLIHLAGLIPAVAAPAAFEHYATALHQEDLLTPGSAG